MSHKTTYVCDWCGEVAADCDRMPDWHLMWSLYGSMSYLSIRNGKLEDLCPECWKALEDMVAKLRDGRKRTT